MGNIITTFTQTFTQLSTYQFSHPRNNENFKLMDKTNKSKTKYNSAIVDNGTNKYV